MTKQTDEATNERNELTAALTEMALQRLSEGRWRVVGIGDAHESVKQEYGLSDGRYAVIVVERER